MTDTRGTPCRHYCGFVDDPSTYYEVFAPLEADSRPPIMMITGGVHSGACYHVTPDGRPGWADDFVRRGRRVVLVDWPGVGRSGFVQPADLSGQMIVDGLATVAAAIGEPVVVLTHSISGAFGWKLLEQHSDLVAALVGVAPAPPGNLGVELGRMVRDEGLRKTVEMASGEAVLELDKELTFPASFHRVKLVGSSKRFPEASIDAYFRSLQGISGRIVYERTNIDGVQLRVEDRSGFAGKRVLVVTGTDDIDHPRELDGRIVQWLGDGGAQAEHLYLGDIGISGNGHMMMLEDNSSQIAAVIDRWIDGSAG
jgi:pimeloyl-ACP methyl ester carboxylesterase